MYAKAEYCDIGYCLLEDRGGFAFQPPRTVFESRSKALGMRAIQNCPAVNTIERQLIEIPSPIALRMSLSIASGKLDFRINSTGTFAKPNVLKSLVSAEPPERWRDPNKPVLRMKLPFFFVTDEPCAASILPPFLSPSLRQWPGTVVAGSYPVTNWPQNITWALEWDKIDEELIIRQGEPLAYAMFEFNDPNKRPKLIEAELTDELAEYRAGMDGVHQLTNQIEELWMKASERRPAKLLTPLSVDA
ncbi:hypothetical protein ACFFUT_17960 [Pseudohalocynthiibacter aestuariivivens]|jgi:hypothetical protein|uniref:Uncharacterized protein n=1 Tax=Pseudohalocynthiibacter aestuariivivens TaxID=1591409 RepID=A0ABV5JMH8_9RHOB|nr:MULTISPECIES: hypothetical protein [Pseudohalocynthiibacter]MBS9717563.1 hypothetical protein [Pseudohalocynthiibacter aestuariivivens]MCK0102761.1 hypothetical protein [Pseudohalocynthiibacter sp. F2068]